MVCPALFTLSCCSACNAVFLSLRVPRAFQSKGQIIGPCLATAGAFVCLLVGCLTSQQQASVSQGRICTDNLTCCHTEIDVADQTFYLTQSQYTDTAPTSSSPDPITPGAWQGSHWSANFEVTGMNRPRKKSRRKRDSNPGPSSLEADALTTRPTRLSAGVTRDVTVSESAFLACHQCCCAGSSFTWGLNLGIFSEAHRQGFSLRCSGFLPSFVGLMVQPIKIKLK